MTEYPVRSNEGFFRTSLINFLNLINTYPISANIAEQKSETLKTQKEMTDYFKERR